MNRIEFNRYGGPEEMCLKEHTLPALGDDEILVRTKAASINPIDWKIRNGQMKILTGRKFPRGMGQDFSGIIEAVGSKVTRFRIGDEVVGTTPVKTSGAFAQALITKESLAVTKPKSLSHEQAATLPIVACTAWTALILKMDLKQGQSVFINGAYGAVGQAATQIAKAVGATVTARVSAEDKESVTRIGADAVLDYKQPIPSKLHGHFDVVFDTHGSLTIAEGRKLAKSGGAVLDINPSTSKMLRIFLSSSHKFVIAKQDEPTMQAVIDLAAKGKLKIAIGRTVPLVSGIELLRGLEAGERIGGKGLIIIDEQP